MAKFLYCMVLMACLASWQGCSKADTSTAAAPTTATAATGNAGQAPTPDLQNSPANAQETGNLPQTDPPESDSPPAADGAAASQPAARTSQGNDGALTSEDGQSALPAGQETGGNAQTPGGTGQSGNGTQEVPAQDGPAQDTAQDVLAQDTATATETQGPATVEEHPFPNRIKAKEFPQGATWINTGGPIELRDLRGKFVVLDFWTYCCINCMHVLPELKKLEKAYPREIVVIGVHSAKFDAEQDSANIRDAVKRYEIEHPVINDADHAVWDSYPVNSWPTLLVIDPEGYLVAANSGEIGFEALDAFFKQALPFYQKRNLIDSTPVHFDLEVHRSEQTPLRYPGKVLADASGDRLFISDSNHNRIVVSSLSGKFLYQIGSGMQGKADGDLATCQFNHPQGMALLNETLFVADTENHALRKVDLQAKTVVTLAGSGNQASSPWPGYNPRMRVFGEEPPDGMRFVGKPQETDLNSPWDLWIHDGALYIAMAGPHQIWRMPLDESEIGPFAGNGREDIVDGPHLPRQPYGLGAASFAQPSGLTSDGSVLFVADSEGSSIRAVPFDVQSEVTTVVGTSHLEQARLFDFGDLDGPADKAKYQHPLAVAYQDGQLYVADTYNNKIRVIDLATRTSSTVAGQGEPGNQDNPPQFDEPTGLSLAGDKLFVADTNNHAIRVIDLAHDNQVSTLNIEGLTPPVLEEPAIFSGETANSVPEIVLQERVVKAANGALQVKVMIHLPEGFKINPLAPFRYKVGSLSPADWISPEFLNAKHRVDPPADTFEFSMPVNAEAGSAELTLSMNVLYCREGVEGVCKVSELKFRVPVRLDPAATGENLLIEHTIQ